MPRKVFSSELISVATVIAILVLTTSVFAARDERTVYSFKGGNDGIDPQSALSTDSAGNLYGTTFHGGGSNQCGVGCGTVFELTPQSGGEWTESVLYQFSGGVTGSFPNAGLVLDSSGNLYGSTQQGGTGALYGVVFELSPSSSGWNETTLYTFTGGSDGGFPNSPPIVDPNGNLYGTTAGGGTGDGVVFELKKSNGSWRETVLYSFTGGRDGSFPEGLSMDASGNLYGVTLVGGAGNSGVLFELKFSNGHWKELTLHSFTGGYDGNLPSGHLIFDKKGSIYGSTSFGGGGGCNGGCGIVFTLALNSHGKWRETVLHVFKNNGHDGNLPLLWFNHGPNLYGVTSGGGPFGLGTVFELLLAFDGSWVEKVLYDFTGGSDGGFPYGLMLNSGKLFGTATQGGPNYGAVFELTP
jgi:uncharacterized repeat protein (TIGR03803 family)